MGVGNAIKKQLQNMHGLHNLKGKARAFRAVHVPLVEAPQDSLIPVGESPEVSVVAILPRSSCSFDAVITLTGDTESEWSEIMSELEEQSVALNADLRRATEDSTPRPTAPLEWKLLNRGEDPRTVKGVVLLGNPQKLTVKAKGAVFSKLRRKSVTRCVRLSRRSALGVRAL